MGKGFVMTAVIIALTLTLIIARVFGLPWRDLFMGLVFGFSAFVFALIAGCVL